MKNIAIIGATGMLGAPVAKQLLVDGYNVRVLSRNPQKARQTLGEKFQYAKADIFDVHSLKAALHDIDAVHLNLSGQSKKTYYANHVVGTQNVVEALRDQPDTLISMISNASAYPEFSSRWDNRYKWEGEQILKQSGHPYLAFLPSWFLESIPLFIQKDNLVQIGASKREIPWIAAADYAKEVSKAYQDSKCRNQRLTIYGPHALPMRAVLEKYAQQHDLALKSMPAWLANLLSWVIRDESLRDITDLLTHYEKHGEKRGAHSICTQTNVDQWILESSISATQ
ncbi:SDR family oxidoreductase [Thaumasiovibrio subtropicus]|uniref:SDR family oxidoreductase n=1 Tax=Thaumasiovibrio subtropicus TaxID=1891207 RepID=UPI000B35225E|nr:NAD(P)H-binding protein [Thaumasiovibrio subtropicus]